MSSWRYTDIRCQLGNYFVISLFAICFILRIIFKVFLWGCYQAWKTHWDTFFGINSPSWPLFIFSLSAPAVAWAIMAHWKWNARWSILLQYNAFIWFCHSHCSCITSLRSSVYISVCALQYIMLRLLTPTEGNIFVSSSWFQARFKVNMCIITKGNDNNSEIMTQYTF